MELTYLLLILSFLFLWWSRESAPQKARIVNSKSIRPLVKSKEILSKKGSQPKKNDEEINLISKDEKERLVKIIVNNGEIIEKIFETSEGEIIRIRSCKEY